MNAVDIWAAVTFGPSTSTVSSIQQNLSFDLNDFDPENLYDWILGGARNRSKWNFADCGEDGIWFEFRKNLQKQVYLAETILELNSKTRLQANVELWFSRQNWSNFIQTFGPKQYPNIVHAENSFRY